MRTTTIALLLAVYGASAFSPLIRNNKLQSSSSSALNAIGVLARKAKEADIRKYCEAGVPDNVMAEYKKISSDDVVLDTAPGPLQELLTRRKGTITVIAEYKRKVENGGFINEQFDPEILSPMFREYGATAISVMADERMGGCTYDDVASFSEEQRRARNEIPGPVTIINSDLVVDEVQLARSVTAGAKAVVLTLGVLGEEKLQKFLKASQDLELEALVAVTSNEEAQTAIDAGAKIVLVSVAGIEEKVACIADLNMPEDRKVIFVGNIFAKNDKGLEEIEEAWGCRDKGFNAVWVADALYKNSQDSLESPGSIIKSMTAKSSLKWASPKASSGKGEGAREYLGDIMM